MKTYVVGTYKKCLGVEFLMSTHIICFSKGVNRRI